METIAIVALTIAAAYHAMKIVETLVPILRR